MALFTREEAGEARPAGRWRRRGRGRPGGAGAAAGHGPGRASSSRLAAGARGGGLQPGCGPGRALGSPRTGTAARGAGGEAVPVVLSLAHQAGSLCFLPGEVAVEGQHRGVAMLGLCRQTARSAGPAPAPPPASPPAARRTKGRGRYLGPCAPGTRPPPAGSARSSAPSSGPPARALRDGGGRCPARSGRLRSPPAPRAPRPRYPDSRGLPVRSAATLLFGPQIDTWRTAAGAANGGRHSCSGGGHWPGTWPMGAGRRPWAGPRMLTDAKLGSDRPAALVTIPKPKLSNSTWWPGPRAR